ncbi:MAG: glycyl-radical enzyme activating protein [Synergistales bacterium]|nr:glycyl-radical enzyme activating protein [Synergistales bacterium]
MMRDYPFWRRSGGGVTLSGGEPLAQPQFAQEFLALCKVRNVHTAIETCLFCGSKLLDDVVQYVDYVQFDMKEMDPARHKELTGLDNDIILENAARLLAGDKALLVRLPYIPGCNDSEDNLRALGRFLESRRPGVQLELLPYHRMGVGRYEGLGMTYLLPDTKPPTKEDVADAADILSEYSVNVFTEGDE